MSARLTANQNKIRLIAVFLFTLMTVGILRFYQGQFHSGGGVDVSNAAALNAAVDESLFVGLRHAPAPEVRQVLSEAAGRPAVLYFGSRLCHDCQRMAPVMAQMITQYPKVYFKKLDVLEDQSKSPAIFRTFKPVSVPMVVFINANGEIRNVLYDYQKPEAVASAINALQRQSATTAGKSVPLKNAAAPIKK